MQQGYNYSVNLFLLIKCILKYKCCNILLYPGPCKFILNCTGQSLSSTKCPSKKSGTHLMFERNPRESC
uniref:Uncharacterized protein n=1 Tax=Arundo donax TaxID=35708 RepID=A0A0A9C3S8_ARUDO